MLAVYLPAYSYTGIMKLRSKQPVKETALYSTVNLLNYVVFREHSGNRHSQCWYLVRYASCQCGQQATADSIRA